MSFVSLMLNNQRSFGELQPQSQLGDARGAFLCVADMHVPLIHHSAPNQR